MLDRSTFIGGSDAAGVLGLSRWDTPLSVWAEKTGQYIKPEVESEAAELGKELEDYVAKRFSRKTGKNVQRAESKYFHPQANFLGATIDRRVVGEDAGLECKTASAWKSKEWEGEEIPQEYIIQCYHYMMVTGLKKWYLAVLIGNQDFKIKELFWDEKFINSMREREVDFWKEYVLTKVPPMGMVTKRDADVLLGLYPVAQEERGIVLSDKANILIENLDAYKKDLKNLEGQIDLHENQLKAMLGEAEFGATGINRIYWQNTLTRRFDTKAFEKVYPDIAKQFKPAKPGRRFWYKPIKGE